MNIESIYNDFQQVRKITRPSHSYQRKSPSVFGVAGDNYIMNAAFQDKINEPEAVCPEEGYIHIGKCYVYDGCYVVMPDLSWLPESVIDYGAAKPILRTLQDTIVNKHYLQISSYNYNTVLIGKSGFSNYGHVISDILPKLVNVGHSGLKSIRLILPEAMYNFQQLIIDILIYFGIDYEIVYHKPGSLKEVRNVFFFTSVSLHNYRKSYSLLEVRDIINKIYFIKPSMTRNVFVTRSGFQNRSIINKLETQSLFSRKFDCEIVEPASLSVIEQIRLFSSAGFVAGGLGAGMANAIWAPKHARVFLIDPGIGDYWFWDLSCVARQYFGWYFNRPLHAFSPACEKKDYEVDLGSLNSALDNYYV